MGKRKLDKAEALRMREAGATYQEIADRFGCSKQWAKASVPSRVGEYSYYRKIPYLGLRRWFATNPKATTSSFTMRCFGTWTRNMTARVQNMCYGRDVHFTIGQIKRMEQITGMTFDELFERDDDGKDSL